MNPKFQSLYGLKFNPFRPDVPIEALYATPTVDAFLRRVELGIADGGYIMISGDPGTGKSLVLRLLTRRLQALRDVVVGTFEHPQSGLLTLLQSRPETLRLSKPHGRRRVRWGAVEPEVPENVRVLRLPTAPTLRR